MKKMFTAPKISPEASLATMTLIGSGDITPPPTGNDGPI